MIHCSGQSDQTEWFCLPSGITIKIKFSLNNILLFEGLYPQIWKLIQNDTSSHIINSFEIEKKTVNIIPFKVFAFVVTIIFDIKITPFSVNCIKYKYGFVSFYTLTLDEK